MTQDGKARGGRSSKRRAIRWATVLLGLLFVAYAISDHPLYGGTPGFGRAQVAMLVMGGLLGLCTLLPLAWNQRVLLAVVSSLFVLLVAEVAVETLFGYRYRPGFRYDERYIFESIPERYNFFKHSPVNGGHGVVSRTNSDGFRGEELLPGDGHTRVVVYGDSFIHALYTPLEGTFTEQLEAELAQRLGRAVEVVNAGISSYGPDQLALKMQDELPRLRPELVLLAVYAGNDYGDLLRNKLFRFDDAGRLRRNQFHLLDELRESFQAANQESILKRAARDALRRLRDVGMYDEVAGADDPDAALVEQWLRQCQDEYESFISGDDTVTVVHVDHYSADVSVLPNSESARFQVRFMEKMLEHIHGITTKAGVSLALLFIPHPLDAVPGYRPGRIDKERYPDYVPTNLTAPLSEMAQRRQWPFVDLFEVYRGRDTKQYYLRGGDDHWNEEGQKVAAQAMARYLLDSDLLTKK